jgi:hypothetical protein
MDTFDHLYTQYMALSKANPVLGAGLALYVAGAVTFFFRSTPAKIGRFLYRQATTTLTLTNAGQGLASENFDAFSKWFLQRDGASYIRNFQLDGSWHKGGAVLGAGNGAVNFFWWRKRLFWMTRKRLEQNQGSYQINYEVTVTMLGRSSAIIRDMVADFRYKPSAEELSVYGFDDGWERRARVGLRKLKTVMASTALKGQLMEDIEFFRDNASWYLDRGLAHKKTFVLYGPPGTGKTSLIKAFASFYGFNVCIINLGHVSDRQLEKAIATMPENSILVFEDFDSTSATKVRRAAKPKVADAPALPVEPLGMLSSTAALRAATPGRLDAPAAGGEETFFSMLTLSGLLNTLDGLIGLDGKLVFMTTNHLDNIDSAVIRAGRVDHIYEVAELHQPEIEDYIRLMFPETPVPEGLAFEKILGCNLQALYFKHHRSVDAFIDAIPKCRELHLVASN